MTEQQLSLGLVPSSVITDPFWLNIEIKKDPLQDGMSVAEAAEMIDATYNIKACEPAALQDIWQQPDTGSEPDIWTASKETIAAAVESLDAKKRFADSITDYTQNCAHNQLQPISDLIAYDVTLKIFRSHASELYKLQMANGTAGAAIKRVGRVVHTITIDNSSSHTFDNPIIRRPVMSWQGFDGPKIRLIGNTAYWDGTVTGILRAEFDTEWDEVTVHVTGDFNDSEMVEGTDSSVMGVGWYSGTESGDEIDDYQDVQCSVLAFYHHQYSEVVLSRPEKDESTTDTDKLNICHFVTSMAGAGGDSDSGGDGAEDDEGKRPDCRQHVNEHIVCECDGKEKSNNHYEIVPCPDGVSENALLDGVERTIYKDCGIRDKVYDPAFYEAVCCESWPFVGFNEKEMPHCERLIKGFARKPTEPEELNYPEGTNFITVSPADGICGTWTITQRIVNRQCCDEVEPLVVSDSSVEVLAPSSWGTIAVTGGKMPVTFKINGAGISFSGGRNEITVDGNQATVISDDEFCGMAYWTAKDGCSSTSGTIRSTQGRWESIDPDSLGDVEWTPTEFNIAGNAYSCGGSWWLGRAYNGKYKVEMFFANASWGDVVDCPSDRSDADKFISSINAIHSTEPAQLVDRGPIVEFYYNYSGRTTYQNDFLDIDAPGWGYWLTSPPYINCHASGGSVVQRTDISNCVHDGSAWEWTC